MHYSKKYSKWGGKKQEEPRKQENQGGWRRVAGVLCSPALSDLSSDVYDVYCIL